MTVPWNIGDRVAKVGQPTIYIIEAFRRSEKGTTAVVRVQHSDSRELIKIDIATPVLYCKVG